MTDSTPPRPYAENTFDMPADAPPIEDLEGGPQDGVYRGTPREQRRQPVTPQAAPQQPQWNGGVNSAVRPQPMAYYQQFASTKDDHLGIIALILALTLPIGGIIVGMMAKKAIQRGTARNEQIVNWALGLGWFFTIINALMILVVLMLMAAAG